MVSINNIINGIKEPTHRYQNSNPSQIFIVGGYVKVRESLYTRVIIWVNNMLDHIDSRAIFLGMNVSCMVYRPKWFRKQKYRQILVTIYLEGLADMAASNWLTSMVENNP